MNENIAYTFADANDHKIEKPQAKTMFSRPIYFPLLLKFWSICFRISRKEEWNVSCVRRRWWLYVQCSFNGRACNNDSEFESLAEYNRAIKTDNRLIERRLICAVCDSGRAKRDHSLKHRHIRIKYVICDN